MVKQKKEEVNNMNEKTVSVLPVRQLCLIALMAALMCLLGPLAVPIGPVPISVMTFIIYLTMYLLGMKINLFFLLFNHLSVLIINYFRHLSIETLLNVNIFFSIVNKQSLI